MLITKTVDTLIRKINGKSPEIQISENSNYIRKCIQIDPKYKKQKYCSNQKYKCLKNTKTRNKYKSKNKKQTNTKKKHDLNEKMFVLEACSLINF